MVRVIVAVHEPQRLVHEISSLGAEVSTPRLTVGDYAIGDALIERTLIAGRLWGQPKPATAEAVPAAIAHVSTHSAGALLAHFGGVAAVVEATDAELGEVTGIGPVRARAIRETLNRRPTSYRSRRSRERRGPST